MGATERPRSHETYRSGYRLKAGNADAVIRFTVILMTGSCTSHVRKDFMLVEFPVACGLIAYVFARMKEIQ